MTNIIKNPRITEKASFGIEQNVYTFDIEKGANKTEIKKAIFALYKVKPIRVNVLPVPKKKTFSKGIVGSKSGGRKALVYLKKGDKIEFV
ncbi:50S ribosomal protein L23 [Candidatus Nomurabacteria bacterium RIFCSPLOWO2_02_FULL_40_10]|uniref:Large ribosomal subunit protein uL23 n=2 Tax=Candidatus Nomuraibacteriota TaxID=1752729 RepID=A0A1F6XX83_9BACT|nr:MAG: 50S ribosomal protein L23 [Candidatus Nomurabacteria bacterium RIFCSPHIGHO2_01_FULL_39_10]OGI98746.1 MAG: 50S ribosomal protein L23 [Candidatus Nomurabacteria bacterium RIFCSPLOWO2_02_FULL_40_10]